MKLANALSQRAELQTCIRQLEERLNNNAQVQEGEESAEDPMELLRELDEDYAQLEALIARINRTNSVTLVDGVPLSDLLARRDCMTGRLGILRGFLSSASSLVKQVDRDAKALRELDETIQEKNWTTELIKL